MRSYVYSAVVVAYCAAAVYIFRCESTQSGVFLSLDSWVNAFIVVYKVCTELNCNWCNTNTNKAEVRTGRSQGPNVIADDRYTLAVTLLFFLHANTYETYNLNFHVIFL